MTRPAPEFAASRASSIPCPARSVNITLQVPSARSMVPLIASNVRPVLPPPDCGLTTRTGFTRCPSRFVAHVGDTAPKRGKEARAGLRPNHAALFEIAHGGDERHDGI